MTRKKGTSEVQRLTKCNELIKNVFRSSHWAEKCSSQASSALTLQTCTQQRTERFNRCMFGAACGSEHYCWGFKCWPPRPTTTTLLLLHVTERRLRWWLKTSSAFTLRGVIAISKEILWIWNAWQLHVLTQWASGCCRFMLRLPNGPEASSDANNQPLKWYSWSVMGMIVENKPWISIRTVHAPPTKAKHHFSLKVAELFSMKIWHLKRQKQTSGRILWLKTEISVNEILKTHQINWYDCDNSTDLLLSYSNTCRERYEMWRTEIPF